VRAPDEPAVRRDGYLPSALLLRASVDNVREAHVDATSRTPEYKRPQPLA